MSQQDMALAASQQVQQQIVAAGGSVPNLAQASALAEAEALKALLERATAAAVSVLHGANALAGRLVASGNDLDRQVAKNKADQAELAKARVYYTQTNNIFPLQKLCGIPTSSSVLAQFPDIDKIPKDWAPAVVEAPAV